MKEPRPPDIRKVEHESFFYGPLIFFIMGFLAGLPISMVTYERFKPRERVLPDLWETMLTSGLVGAAGSFVIVGLLAIRIERGNAAERRRYARELAQYEQDRQAQIDTARKAYANAYAVYLPTWQAWHQMYRQHVAELTSYTAWERDAVAAFGPFRDRVLAAIDAFKVLHLNIDKRARLELELTALADREALFREAFADAARQQRDFGLFRLLEADPALAAQIPELEKFKADEGLAVVQAILPPLPSIAPELRQVRQKPEPPPRPEAPRGILFWQNGGMNAAPVPPEKVVFTPN